MQASDWYADANRRASDMTENIPNFRPELNAILRLTRRLITGQTRLNLPQTDSGATTIDVSPYSRPGAKTWKNWRIDS